MIVKTESGETPRRAQERNTPVKKKRKAKPQQRNASVENAIHAALARIDELLIEGTNDGTIDLPQPANRKAIDAMLENRAPSVRIALLFLLFYWRIERKWNRRSVPTGTRGKWGDKLLAEQLEIRGITLHGNVTAFGENLGWKGNVRKFDLSRDGRFDLLRALAEINERELTRVTDYLAFRFAESKVTRSVIPPIRSDVLTFARAKALFHKLVMTPSEGFIQQFLIAALLNVHRTRIGAEISTHHPHASDKYDDTAGDIEERINGELSRAYEVTVRPDWKNRITDFKAKMDRFSISKYVIIASDINRDSDWSEPARLLLNIEPYGRDIAIIDILDVVNVFAAELLPVELKKAIQIAFDYICNRKLCGRNDIRESYSNVVTEWLDTSVSTT